MIFLYLLFVSSLKTASTRNLQSRLKESPITIVLFHMRSLQQTKTIQEIFDQLEKKYEPNIRFLRVDDKRIAQQIDISFAQQIGVYRGTFFSGFYSGKWTFEALDSFCENVLNSDFYYINNYFELFRFQNSGDVNILISDEKSVTKATSL